MVRLTSKSLIEVSLRRSAMETPWAVVRTWTMDPGTAWEENQVDVFIFKSDKAAMDWTYSQEENENVSYYVLPTSAAL